MFGAGGEYKNAFQALVAGALFGYGLARLASRYFPALEMPPLLPLVVSVVVLLTAAVVASVFPAGRAARDCRGVYYR